MPETHSRPLTPAQVASRLGCSTRQARRLLAQKKIRGWKIGADWRASPEAVVEFMYPKDQAGEG